MYSFGYNETQPGMGVRHGGELDLVWQRSGSTDAVALELQHAVGGYWSNFIRNGTPGAPTGSESWPQWPTLQGEGRSEGEAPADRHLDFAPNGHATARSHFYGATCGAWEAYRARGTLQRTRFIGFGYLC